MSKSDGMTQHTHLNKNGELVIFCLPEVYATDIIHQIPLIRRTDLAQIYELQHERQEQENICRLSNQSVSEEMLEPYTFFL